MRILPGVVTEFNQGESVELRRRRQQHPGLHRQRHPRRRATPCRSTARRSSTSAATTASSSSLNNDMVQEVKVQSSNFAAEYGTGGMNVSGVTKSGTSKFHGSLLRLLARLPVRRQRSVEQHHADAEAEEHVSVSRAATSAARSRSATATRRTRTGCSSSSRSKRSGSRSTRARTSRARFSQAMKNGDFSELLANRGSNLNSIPQLRIPQGFPNAGEPAPNNDMRPYMTADRPVLREPVSAAELQRSRQPLQLRLQPARADQPLRLQGALRLEHQRQHQGLRPHRARGRNGRERRAACGGRPRDVVALPTPNVGENKRPVVSPATSSSVLSPTMTNEVARQLQPADARQPLQGSGRCSLQGAGGITFSGIFPPARRARTSRRTCCTGGAAAARSATCGRRRTTCTRTTTRCSSATS